jgi:hypothetical protein
MDVRYFTKLFYAILIASTFYLSGCGNKSETEPLYQTPIRIPFELMTDVKITIPEGTHASLIDGVWDGSMRFDPPVHPIGHVSLLQSNGKAIVLVNTEITNGVVTTRDFGDIEVWLLGAGPRGGGLEFRASPRQIKAMKQYLGIE